MIGVFLEEGAKAGTIVQLITEMNDRLIGKVLELTERKMGKNPGPHVLLALGSGGTKEQTLKTIQNYALLYEASAFQSECDNSKNFFTTFFHAIQENIFQLGFLYDPYSNGVGNILRCQSLEFLWNRLSPSQILSKTKRP